MTFDSSTLCARTVAGDAELTLPALGLSLGQRRVLSLLHDPSAVDELAQKHHLEPAKLERDLTRLADLRLVVVQGSIVAAPPAPTRVVALITPMAPVVIGGSTRRLHVMAFAAAATGLLAAAIWYGTRSHNLESSPNSAAVVATLAPATTAPSEAPAPQVSRTANDTASSIGVPTTAIVLRGSAVTPERRPEVRPGLPLLAAGAPAPAPAPLPGALAATAERPAPPPKAEPVATTQAAPAPAAMAAPAPLAANPAATAPAVADSPAPALLASVNAALAPRPAAPAPLKAISREPPDFPKEAIADGLKGGVVTARLHVDARGKVTGVDILGAQPPRVFDRAVRRALLQWQFEPPAAGAAADVDVDVKFQRD